MSACQIVPFPSVRRVAYVRNLANMMVHYRPEAAERTLAAQLNAQRAAMLRRGLTPDVVERELRALELAVRARLWTIVMQGGDVA
jgi:hypothetical protein